jgi:hypothetical protein
VSKLTLDYLGTYADHVYEIVRADTIDMDSVYGDYIQQMVGVYGLNTLIENGFVESCGVINGRRLYVLVERKYRKENLYA